MDNIDRIHAVVKAADRLNQCIAEFPNEPGAWSEYLNALHDALEKCPGTWTHAISVSTETVQSAENRYGVA